MTLALDRPAEDAEGEVLLEADDVGEDEHIAEDLESLPDGFAGCEHRREILLNLGDVDFRGVSEQAAEASHNVTWCVGGAEAGAFIPVTDHCR